MSRRRRGRLVHQPPWDEERARVVLTDAANQMARGSGLSDRTLGRIAAVLDPAAPNSRAAFETALRRAGWGEFRVQRAVDEVLRVERPAAERAYLSFWSALSTEVRAALFVGVAFAIGGVRGMAVALFIVFIAVVLTTYDGR